MPKASISPGAVENATREYLEAEDTILAWIEDRCECGKNKEASAASLFASWKAWTELTGEFTGTAKAFGIKLAEHGFEPTRAGGDRTKMWRGLSLIETAQPPRWHDDI